MIIRVDKRRLPGKAARTDCPASACSRSRTRVLSSHTGMRRRRSRSMASAFPIRTVEVRGIGVWRFAGSTGRIADLHR